MCCLLDAILSCPTKRASMDSNARLSFRRQAVLTLHAEGRILQSMRVCMCLFACMQTDCACALLVSVFVLSIYFLALFCITSC